MKFSIFTIYQNYTLASFFLFLWGGGGGYVTLDLKLIKANCMFSKCKFVFL